MRDERSLLVVVEGTRVYDQQSTSEESKKSKMIEKIIAVGTPLTSTIAAIILLARSGVTVLNGINQGETLETLACDTLMSTRVTNSQNNTVTNFIETMLAYMVSGISSGGSSYSYEKTGVSTSGSGSNPHLTEQSMQIINSMAQSLITLCQQNPCTPTWRLFGSSRQNANFTFNDGTLGRLTCNTTTLDKVGIGLIIFSALWLLMVALVIYKRRQMTSELNRATTPVEGTPLSTIGLDGQPVPLSYLELPETTAPSPSRSN